MVPTLQCAREGACCDYGLYVGASNANASSLVHISSQALALKMYLNATFSTLMLDSMESWLKVRILLLHTLVTSVLLSVCAACGELAQGPTTLCSC